MDVMRGYQQTEAGVIPEDWNAMPLSEIGEALIGLTYGLADVATDGVLVLRSSNVQKGALCFDDNVFVTSDVPERIMVKQGDILICVRNGSRELIGKCALIDERARGMTFGAFMAVFRTADSGFILQQFKSSLIQRQIRDHLGATINQITNRSLNSFVAALPILKVEREAIAEALSDADALIESLEQLLAKKRQIKQGAMEELLTGKKRLPGFVGQWQHLAIGEFTDCTAGGTPSTRRPDYWGGSIRWMNSGELNLKYVNEVEGRITEEGYRNSSTKLLPSGCVLIGLAGQGKTRGTVAINLVPLCTNQSIAAIFPNDSFDAKYLYFRVFVKSCG